MIGSTKVEGSDAARRLNATATGVKWFMTELILGHHGDLCDLGVRLDRRLPLEMFPINISLHLDVAALSHRSADEFGGRVTDSGCAHGPCRVNHITRCNHGHNEALGPRKTADCLSCVR